MVSSSTILNLEIPPGAPAGGALPLFLREMEPSIGRGRGGSQVTPEGASILSFNLSGLAIRAGPLSGP